MTSKTLKQILDEFDAINSGGGSYPMASLYLTRAFALTQTFTEAEKTAFIGIVEANLERLHRPLHLSLTKPGPNPPQPHGELQ